MTEQQKKEIAIITQQLATIKEQINKANAETKPQIEKRDKLNEEFKKLRQNIDELKNQRDDLNEKVKTLKRQRDEARVRIRTIIEEVKTRKQEITKLIGKIPQKSHQELRKELEGVEWRIQTNSLGIQEEKRLIENVKRLEIQLNVVRKIERQSKKIVELQKEFETLKMKAEVAHNELTETAKKSQEIHTHMLAKIYESKGIKTEADSLHDVYVHVKEQLKPLHEELKKLMEQKQKLQDALRQEDEKRKKNIEKELKEKLESQARNKLQRGERLSWDEFKLLADNESKDV